MSWISNNTVARVSFQDESVLSLASFEDSGSSHRSRLILAVLFLLCTLLGDSVARAPVILMRETPKTADPRVEAALEFARLIGAESGFASMYWYDRLVWTQYVNSRQEAFIKAAERALRTK